MVGTYEPYVDVCRRLAELSPCRGGVQKSVLVNSGAEAVENAVKIARCATGRPAVVVFEKAFHGRTLLTMTMTSKVVPYKKGFGPFAPEVYRAPAPYPYRGVCSDDAIAGLRRLLTLEVDPESVACVVLELAEPAPERAAAVVAAAFDRGLLLLTCGACGNVVCLLPPLTIEDDELDEGLRILEESLAAVLG
jgi:4-aminobutyrate aminotransferase-like enzyme